MCIPGLAPLALAAPSHAASADAPQHVFLVDGVGNRTQIATLMVSKQSCTLDMNDAVFGEFFLSMRPFKCLDGGEKLCCHVPYPYEIARKISKGDLKDLEYDLLFVWKNANDYGIDMWNGLYFRIEPDGDGWRRRVREIDMGGLAVPPPAGDLRPIRDSDIHEADPASHTLPELLIE